MGRHYRKRRPRYEREGRTPRWKRKAWMRWIRNGGMERDARRAIDALTTRLPALVRGVAASCVRLVESTQGFADEVMRLHKQQSQEST